MSTQPATIATFSGLASGIDTAGIISKLQAFAQQPITQLTKDSKGLNDQLTAYQAFNAALAGVQSAATSLTLPNTFASNTASSSNTAVATVTAGSGALTGTHTLTVNTLAQAQQVVSKAYTSNNLGLNETGAFTINGHSISVTTSDTLSSLASKINAATAGVTASVVSTGANQYQLSITSNKSGVAQTISAVDTTGSVLSDLSIANGANTIRQHVGANGAASITQTSSSGTLATLFGDAINTGPSGTVTIDNGNGASGTVDIDYNKDSLSTIAGKINAAGITGITAQIVSLPDANGNAGGGGQQLVINNSTGHDPVFTDSNSVLASLGFTQKATAGVNQPVAAQDANFTYDGLIYTRASNTVKDLIPGATVSLLQQTPTGVSPTPATTTLSISQNTASIINSVQNFTTAYNNVVDYINNQNTFTPPTGDNKGTLDPSPPLFGSQVLTDVQQLLGNALGVNSGSTTLGSIGINLDPTTGHLVVDSATLGNSLQSNPTSVKSLFGVIGKTTNNNIQYVGAGPNTKQSTGAGYAVTIKTAASQSTATSTVAQTVVSTQAETLSFTGLNFPTALSLTLSSGNSLQDSVNQINGDSRLNSLLSASIDGTGKLLISSKAYGGNTGFSVSSSLAAASNNSGIGGAPTYTIGTDVAGTINGEAAIGHGQTLSGLAGNKYTDGLTLTVTATTPGDYGSVTTTQGIGTQLNNLLATVLDPTNGQVQQAENALNTQITNNEQQIEKVNAEVADQTAFLQQMFADMETRVSQLQQQGQAFAAQATGLVPWNNKSN